MFRLIPRQGELHCTYLDEKNIFLGPKTVDQEIPCQYTYLFGAK